MPGRARCGACGRGRDLDRRRRRHGTTAALASLLVQLLDLSHQRPHLIFEGFHAGRIGAALWQACRRTLPAATATAGERFERADHHLHVGQLLLQLFDTLAQPDIHCRCSPERPRPVVSEAPVVACLVGAGRGPDGCCASARPAQALRITATRLIARNRSDIGMVSIGMMNTVSCLAELRRGTAALMSSRQGPLSTPCCYRCGTPANGWPLRVGSKPSPGGTR